MSRKFRTLLVTAVIALPPIIVVVISAISPSPSFPNLPTPNGHDDFVKAGESIKGDVSGVSAKTQEELQMLVATNAESLRLLNLGLTRRCSVPTAQVLKTLKVSNAISLICLAQLKAAEGRLAEMEGRRFEATQSYLADLKLGNEICRGGFAIDSLAGAASEAIGGIALSKLVYELTPDETLPVIQRLEAIDAARVPWSEVSHNERLLLRDWFLHNIGHPLNGVKELWQARQMLQTFEIKHSQATARIRLLATELALCCYRSSQGQAPSRLEEVVPKYLQRVPVDPFNDQPLAYTPQGTNWILYSVGPGGGTPAAGSPSGTGRLFYNSR